MLDILEAYMSIMVKAIIFTDERINSKNVFSRIHAAVNVLNQRY